VKSRQHVQEVNGVGSAIGHCYSDSIVAGMCVGLTFLLLPPEKYVSHTITLRSMSASILAGKALAPPAPDRDRPSTPAHHQCRTRRAAQHMCTLLKQCGDVSAHVHVAQAMR